MHALCSPTPLSTLLLSAFLPTVAVAQQVIGTTYNVDSSVGSRGALLSSPGVLITRFDRDEIRGYGMDASRPGKHVINGVKVTLVDYDASTPETYSIVLYGESASAPGFPNTQAPLRTVGPFTLTIPGTGLQSTTVIHTLGPAVEAPTAGDVFVGVQLSTGVGWPMDGLSVGTLLAQQTRWPIYDKPGPAPIQHQGYGMFYEPATQSINYNTPRLLLIDLMANGPGGMCTAITNQTSFPPSNTAPGTASMFSALHPDAASPPNTTGRADDVGFVYLDQSRPNGMPVFFLADFGNFGPDVYLSTIVPGSVGALCLNAASATNIGLALLNNGEASQVATIPASLRPILRGTSLVRQAIALDPVTNALRASPCSKQVF